MSNKEQLIEILTQRYIRYDDKNSRMWHYLEKC